MIALGSDHGGFELKEILKKFLESEGYEYIDLGTFDESSVDYPDIAKLVCEKIISKECEKGILLCGTGLGMNMCANKYRGIRAAQCHDTFSARLTRIHNDANVLTMGGRVIGPELAKDVVKAFLTNEFEGGRHQTRIDKMMNIQK